MFARRPNGGRTWLPKFRCYACRVAFTPTLHDRDLCPRCAAGNRLYGALRAYRAANGGV